MNSWHSYPSIYNIGHKAIDALLTVSVNVEEKIDGSQFSFGVGTNGEIHVRSKGAQMYVDAPEKMFSQAVETVKRLAPQLTPGWTYRAEYLRSPKHNSLCYSRIPVGHLIIFDINTDEASYLSWEDKCAEASRLGLEVVPRLFTGIINSITDFREFLNTESCLGGQKIEGVVVKPRDYNLYGPDKKVLMGKFVSEHFKEVHAKEWKTSNPTQGDILRVLGDTYKTPARWQKAVIHLKERGLLEGSPRDIGTLIKEVPEDIRRECAAEIRDALWAWAWPSIRRMTIAGLPEWYKEELLKNAFKGASE